MSKKLLLILATLFLLCSCGSQDSNTSNEIPARVSYDYFDTVSFIYNYGEDSTDEFKEKADAVFDILEEYHKLTDIYNAYEGINNLYTINQNAGSPVKVDEKLIVFLKYCKDLYTLTNGKTNVMLGSVLKLWHNHRDAAEGTQLHNSIPTEDELLEANKHTSIDNLIIDDVNNTVTILDPMASIDVGSIAKGYATERASDYLFENNGNSYVLNIGGNIRIIGTKTDGSGWNTNIKDPNDTSKYALKINIKNIACVTSGNYERYYYVDGKRYHHIIDPDTLYPAEYFGSVTILCQDSGLADGLSTALYCMSYEDGLKLVESLDNVDAIWISLDGEIKYSSNVEDLIVNN